MSDSMAPAFKLAFLSLLPRQAARNRLARMEAQTTGAAPALEGKANNDGYSPMGCMWPRNKRCNSGE